MKITDALEFIKVHVGSPLVFRFISLKAMFSGNWRSFLQQVTMPIIFLFIQGFHFRENYYNMVRNEYFKQITVLMCLYLWLVYFTL